MAAIHFTDSARQLATRLLAVPHRGESESVVVIGWWNGDKELLRQANGLAIWNEGEVPSWMAFVIPWAKTIDPEIEPVEIDGLMVVCDEAVRLASGVLMVDVTGTVTDRVAILSVEHQSE